MIRKTPPLQYASHFPFYCGLLVAALLTITSIADAQEPQPIEVRRMVIDLELAKVVGVSNKTKKDDELASVGIYNIQYSQAFQSQNNFYANTLKEYIEEAFVQQGFKVEGYGHVFQEVRSNISPRFALAFDLNDLLFNYFLQFGSTQPNIFHTQMNVRLQVLNLHTEMIELNKKISSKFYSTATGLPIGTADFSNYFEKAFAQLVDDMLGDPEIKDILYASAKPTPPQFDTEVLLPIAGAPERTPIKSAMEATVTIKNGSSHGSGSIISREGLILTCHHNINAAEEVQIIFSNGIRTTAKVLRKDPEYDLALLQLTDIAASPLYLAGNAQPEPGEEAWVIGTPATTELGQSVSRGIVSGNRIIEDKEYIQTDASINRGNSGGPLLNAQDRIIGMVNAKVIGSGVEGLGFAIPTAIITERLKLVVE
ncbi:trypsin-like serine protease [Cryomorpha ignava]|uniref:Trypsin-like serine protease n=1 Tax=Cryomorpha ignava TaxID=101383 RepID=A0A7K3WVY1_9FLAO|nr:trypsin-like peptidase domain-containing protein [Cryomorpha ignava]NEN25830.1 trypsin-like serine protease [Cryomorpha ignava]